ncbi:MAG TPA: TolC family protein [Candidatus Angelobacter sp.]|nr:TolC family protein [Candidatus Angelobacter sp.]
MDFHFLTFAGRLWRPVVCGCAVAAVCLGASAGLAEDSFLSTNSGPTLNLKLDDYLRMVAERNETLQAQMLETEAAHYKERGEWGIFEPNATASVTREGNRRQNNTEQEAAQSGQPVFDERNTIYDTALETLVPTGGKIRLGFTESDLFNNVNPVPFFGSTNNVFTRQFQSFAGVSFTQPLLKNAGQTVTMANIRIAAMESDIAFQQYRRQLMLAISQAEAAYWNLYFAQEQLSFFKQSVLLAQTVLSDALGRLKAGQASELDVMEAQSGLGLRESKQNEALQNFYDALGQVQTFSEMSPLENGRELRAVDRPPAAVTTPSYAESYQRAYDLNPDYLIQLQKVEQEKVRLGVARNQRLPELDFKGAYGYNGLGSTPGDSLNFLESRDFPSWSMGLELHIPLGGGIKERNDFKAAKLTLQESVANLNAIQTQIANALDAGIRKTRRWQESIQSYQSVIDFNESLLKTQEARLRAGTIEPRKVLEVEADLFDARQSLAEALVQRQRALLALQLAEGTILKEIHLDTTREELRRKTEAMLSRHSLPLNAFQPILLSPDSYTP